MPTVALFTNPLPWFHPTGLNFILGHKKTPKLRAVVRGFLVVRYANPNYTILNESFRTNVSSANI